MGKAVCRFVRSRTIFAIFACLVGSLAIVSVARADETSRIEARREALREWSSLANGRTDFQVSDPAVVPKTLALAVERTACRYKEVINEIPVRFIRVKGLRLAIVFCRPSVVGWHQVFDLSDLSNPSLMQFPVMLDRGFGTTPRPGVIIWKEGTDIFETLVMNDFGPSPVIRSTYRLDTSLVSFVLQRVEVEDTRSQGQSTIWEAPPWLAPPGSR